MSENGWMRVYMVQLAMTTTVEGHQSQTGVAGNETAKKLLQLSEPLFLLCHHHPFQNEEEESSDGKKVPSVQSWQW